MEKKAWVHHSRHYKDAIKYMVNREKGKETSLRTPFRKVNNATVDGFEFNTVTIFGGRPASGKTLLLDQFTREVFKLNPQIPKLKVLDFQFEMLGRTTKLREFIALTKKKYTELLSANGEKISKEVINKCIQLAQDRAKLNIDVVEKSCTVREFERIIRDYMETYSYMEPVKTPDGMVTKKKYCHTMIRVDHSILFEKDKTEKDLQATLSELGKCLTRLKREYPIAFFILSQLNRSIESPERNKDGVYGNHILETDIFGSDELMQHADYVFGINRPAKKFIKFYGPEEYIIADETVLVFHIIKARNGNTGMFFMKANFSEMEILDMETPGCKPKPAKGGPKVAA